MQFRLWFQKSKVRWFHLVIIKDHQLTKVADENSTFFCVLFYGPNEGLVRDNIDKLTQNLINKDEYEQLNFNAKELDDDPQALDNSLRTVSMFYKNKLVIVNSLKDKHSKSIESILANPPENVSIFIKSENLSKSSKIRKLFENGKTCFALACYEDDYQSIIKNIEIFIKENGYSIDRDVKNYLINSLSNDRMISKNELEKIKLYYNDPNKKIDLDDIKNLLNDSSSQNLSKMNVNVMYGNTLRGSKIVNKLLSEGASPVSLIRSLINYTTRVYQTKIEMKKGSSFEVAIRTLKPPVFWKEKESFQQHCNNWPFKMLEENLYKLAETEVACKLNSKLAIIYCEKSILLIANNGKKYFKI